MRSCTLLLLSLLSAWSFAGGDTRAINNLDGLMIGSLLDKETTFDCGCSFYTPLEKKEKGAEILQWTDGEMAHMFISGNLLNLKVQVPMPHAERLQQEVPLRLSSPGTTIQGDLVSTFVCSKGSLSCEVTEFTGTLKVQHGGRSASIPVWGSCGC